MKTFLVLTVLASLFPAVLADAQSVISLNFKQNPLFEVSTGNVDLALPDDGSSLTLGADLTVSGGSGRYTYVWTDGNKDVLGEESTLTVSTPGTYLLTISDQCQCSHEVGFNLTSAGIEDVLPDVAVEIRGREVILGGMEARQVSLFSTSGMMVYLKTMVSPAGSFSLDEVPAGIYMMQVMTSAGRLITRKIILD